MLFAELGYRTVFVDQYPDTMNCCSKPETTSFYGLIAHDVTGGGGGGGWAAGGGLVASAIPRPGPTKTAYDYILA